MDDVFEYVRQSMYIEEYGKDTLDDSSVEGEDDESDDENSKTNTKNNLSSEIDEEGNHVDKEGGNSDEQTKDDTAITVDENELEDILVPSEYIFPSFMAYVAYGPFVESSKQLTLLLTGDAAKGNTRSRAEKGKLNLKKK